VGRRLAGPAPPLRPATEADAPVLAVLMNEASHGLSLHAWRQTAGAGADPWSVGAELQAARAREGLWTVIDDGDAPVAGLQVWPPGGGAPGHSLSAVSRPQVELRALVPDALYINVVATLPEARGRGLGSRLMQAAEAMARAGGMDRLSLIVADANAGARRLYARLGYRQVASRPMVKDGWEGRGAEWLLLVKDLA
jgi:ribosomal protein S18 acetylase RimI-like enzyme